MAQGKKSFIVYVDWKGVFDELPNEEAGLLIKHIFAYVNDENPKSDNLLIRAVFANIKTTLKRDLHKYEVIREKRSLAGKASADKRQQVLTSVESVDDVLCVSVNDSVNVNDNVIEDNKKVSKETLAHKKNIRELEFKKEVHEIGKQYTQKMRDEFCDYWTESNKDGFKMKYEMQKTFDISRRLAKWNSNNFNGIINNTKQPPTLTFNPLKHEKYIPR
jgi:hypothetical protein